MNEILVIQLLSPYFFLTFDVFNQKKEDISQNSKDLPNNVQIFE